MKNQVIAKFNDLDSLLDESQAAEFLSLAIRTLSKWRCYGGGPRFVKISSKAIRYRRRDLLEWTENRIVSSTSEASQASKGR